MKIAVSGDGLNVFTTGFPARGMLKYLVDLRANDHFVIFYTRPCNNPLLQQYFNDLHSRNNVQPIYLKKSKLNIMWNRFNGRANYIPPDNFDLFINPSFLEYHSKFKCPQIAIVQDLSIIKGQSTLSYPWLRKIADKHSKKRVFAQPNIQIKAVSAYTQKDVFNTFTNIKADIKVIHNGIDDFWFRNSDVELPELAKKHPYFIWWGLISRRKNIARLIRIITEMREQNHTIPRLILVGSIASHAKKEISALIENNRHVSLIPFQPNETIRQLVKNSVGLIFPSHHEGFGLPVIEAFSQGTPVACSNNTSLPEVANGLGVLFNEDDNDDIKAAILSLINYNHENSSELIDYARTFTYENRATLFSDAINSLTERTCKYD